MENEYEDEGEGLEVPMNSVKLTTIENYYVNTIKFGAPPSREALEATKDAGLNVLTGWCTMIYHQDDNDLKNAIQRTYQGSFEQAEAVHEEGIKIAKGMIKKEQEKKSRKQDTH